MKLISRNDNFNDHTLGYGDTMWEDEDGHIYLYTTSNYKVAVARTATRDLGSQWEYYVADPQGNFSWTTQYPQPKMLKILQLSLWKVHALCLGYLKR